MIARGVAQSSAQASQRAGGDPLRAALWVIGAIASFSTMAVAGRILGDAAYTAAPLSSFEIMFWRSIVGLPIVVGLLALSSGGFAQLRTTQFSAHATRHTIHFAGQNFWFIAITMIPLAEVIALEFTSPVWVALLAPLLLSEPLTRGRIIAAALGFCGVMIVARPGFEALHVGQAFALGAAISFALTNVGTKLLLKGGDSALCVVFWMTLSQTAMALVCIWVDTGGPPPMRFGADLVWIIVIALAGTAAHFTLTNAYASADATVVAPMEFARLPIVALVAVAVFADPFVIWVLIGGAVIFLGNFINIRMERARRD